MTTELQKSIIALRQQYPNMKAFRMAKQLRCSREMVRQVLIREHMPTKVVNPCKVTYVCNWCGGEIKTHAKWFCSDACHKAYYEDELVCSFCGEPYKLSRNQAKHRVLRSKSGRNYCTKTCQGKDIAIRYGFVAHPENIRSRDVK